VGYSGRPDLAALALDRRTSVRYIAWMVELKLPAERPGPISWFGGHRPMIDDVNECAHCGERKYFPDHLSELAGLHGSPAFI
jgi:hypothetical protein